MLKFENVANTGDYIRAYDFKPMKGREDAYIEGTVLGVSTENGYKAFKIKVEADKFGSEIETVEFEGNRVGKIFFVPMETSFMEYDARIINLSNI
jgi:hypothetical protein